MSSSLKVAAATLALALGPPALTLAATAAPGRGQAPAVPLMSPIAPRDGQAVADLQTCRVAVAPRERYATFGAQMSQVPGGRRMAIRIGLRQRTPPGHTYRALSAPGLGVWRQSLRGVRVYRYVKQVVDLPAPATLRAAVDYRWLDARGRVIRRARRLSSPCVQPDERPRLVLGPVTVVPQLGSSSDSYRMIVRDTGRGPATSFVVALAVNGRRAGAPSVQRLSAAGVTSVAVDGPRCVAGGVVQVTLDPGRHVDEAPGGGRARTLACPLPQAPGAGVTP